MLGTTIYLHGCHHPMSGQSAYAIQFGSTALRQGTWRGYDGFAGRLGFAAYAGLQTLG